MLPSASLQPDESTCPTACSSKCTSIVDLEKFGTQVLVSSNPDKHEAPFQSAKNPISHIDQLRTWLLLPILCSAQFFDIFASSSALVALPEIGVKLNLSPGALQWVVSAYTLTFASFQLMGGRLSDIYHPKPVFCTGFAIVGLFSVLCAVSVHPIMLIVFRAIQGIGAAFTLPSSISLIVQSYSDPHEQGQALAAFAVFGAVGNVTGFVLGGVLTSRIGWKWVFYIVAILVLPLCALSVVALPNATAEGGGKQRRVDVPGVLILTGGLVLFVYAISDANTVGWAKPQILVTLIMSIAFIISFFFVERVVKDPAVPPSTWSNKNFLPLFIYCLSLYWFLTGAELQLVQIFQDLFHWSPLKASLHFIPIGIAGGTSSTLTGKYGHKVPRKVLLIFGQLLMAVGSIFFAFADTPDKYWSFVFPGMLISVTGLAAAYVGANITIMGDARKGEEGVVGALMNTSFQLGATVGVAVLAAITLGVNKSQSVELVSLINGYEASFWSLVGLHGLMIVIVLATVR